MSKFVERFPSKKLPEEPMVIFVGEQHENMAYGSLVEKIIKDSEEKGLSVQVFSEFRSQEQKIEEEIKMGGALRNKPDDKTFEETKKFLNERYIEIGNLDKRNEEQERLRQSYIKDGLTKRTLFEKYQDNVDHPDFLKMMESDVGNEEVSFDDFVSNYRAPLHYKELHQEMAGDLRKHLDSPDVVIIVTGFGHTYGLDQELNDDFKDCKKFVVTNFLDNVPIEKMSNKKKFEYRAADCCNEITSDGLLGFDVDPTTKEASIPPKIETALEKKSHENSFAERSGITAGRVKSLVEKIEQKGGEQFTRR